MASGDSDDRILASILVLVNGIANQKCKLSLRAQKKKNMETISQTVKEDRKTGN